ncbi:Histidine kinase [Amycolatopsis xylanica]|uniref:histidine kinase n=1 Tax=Amycolatopsis xylanica TaxID=589385 RepID=A0A1H3AX59_9PSEU|nr:sensor histidine kinase [Amycolatopsis xylanica]SDX34008.1 Histidine kinase [Amycolatopsis xylanica]
MTRYLIALRRSFVLAGLAIVGLLPLLGTLVALVFICSGVLIWFAPPVVEWCRRYVNRMRHVATELTGVELPAPYRAEPPEPEREADGWYRDGNSLYRKPKWVWVNRRIEWVFEDPATFRDGMWLVLNPVVGLLLPLVTVFAGPIAVRSYGRWLHGRLSRTPTFQGLRWLNKHGEAFGHLMGFLAVSTLQFLFGLCVLCTIITPIGAGTTVAYRKFVNMLRDATSKWSGVEIEVPYLPEPRFPVARPDGLYQLGKQLYESPWWPALVNRMVWVQRDRATWRDLAAGVLIPLVSLAALVLPFGFVAAAWWPPFDPDFPVWARIVLPFVLTGIGFACSPPWLARAVARFARLLLGPTEASRLALRVERLERTRTDASAAQAAELRRIERDLHDGVQSRLVAMGMKLGALEALIDRDPEKAKEMAAELRRNSSDTLTELRDLVRGVHPPVLTERGLGDAVRALALDSPLRVEVSVDLPGRIEPPVEACAYFAVSELLGNAVKHGQAERATVSLGFERGRLVVVVTDSGRGGANPVRGSGLRGIERRLGAFDGKLTVDSPPGGPTAVTLEIPCQLEPSSPKTSTCSETD